MYGLNLAAPLAALYGWPLLIFILGVISITRLVTEDTILDGPRNWFFTHWPHEGFQSKTRPKRGNYTIISQGIYYVNEDTWLGKLASCPWCASFWIAGLLWLAFWAWPIATTFVLVPLGIRVLAGAFIHKTN